MGLASRANNYLGRQLLFVKKQETRDKKQETRSKRQEKRSEILEARYESLNKRSKIHEPLDFSRPTLSRKATQIILNIEYRMSNAD